MSMRLDRAAVTSKLRKKAEDMYLWVRWGDGGEYEILDELSDFAEIAQEYGVVNSFEMQDTYGVTDDDLFYGNNYISLYWGDIDAQPIQSITSEELSYINRDFKEGNRRVERIAKRLDKASVDSGLRR